MDEGGGDVGVAISHELKWAFDFCWWRKLNHWKMSTPYFVVSSGITKLKELLNSKHYWYTSAFCHDAPPWIYMYKRWQEQFTECPCYWVSLFQRFWEYSLVVDGLCLLPAHQVWCWPDSTSGAEEFSGQLVIVSVFFSQKERSRSDDHLWTWFENNQVVQSVSSLSTDAVTMLPSLPCCEEKSYKYRVCWQKMQPIIVFEDCLRTA